MSENSVVNGGKDVKLTQYNEKLTYLDLGAGNGFLDIRAAGTVGADPEYRTGQIPDGYTLIEYIISGRAYIGKGSAQTALPGDLVILRGVIQTDSEPDGNIKYVNDPSSPVEKLWVTLKGRFMEAASELYDIKAPVTIKRAPGSREPLERMITDLSSFGYRRADACHSLLGVFEATLGETGEEEVPLAKRIRDVLDRHIARPVKSADIAAYFCLSERHLERVFESEFGVTIFGYLRGKRFIAACRDLRTTDELIYRIASRYQLGSASHFAKEFTERYGVSPTEYRERFRHGSTVAEEDTGKYIGTIYDGIKVE